MAQPGVMVTIGGEYGHWWIRMTIYCAH